MSNCIGDIVECIDNSDFHNQLTLGKTYKVLDVSVKHLTIYRDDYRDDLRIPKIGNYLIERFKPVDKFEGILTYEQSLIEIKEIVTEMLTWELEDYVTDELVKVLKLCK